MIADSRIRTPKRPKFLFLGGHVAVDFANTFLPPPGLNVEFLRSWADVIEWLKAAGLVHGEGLRPSDHESPKALEIVHNLRNQWKKTLDEIMAGHPVPKAFIEQLNAILRTDNFHEILHQDHGKHLHLHRSASPLQGLALVMARLAGAMAEFLTSAKFEYLRRCANKDSCVLSFYDTTKNHRRQWCSNGTCGNRDKVAKFRSRHRKSENH